MFKKLTNYFVRGKIDICRCTIKEGDSDEQFTMSPGELKKDFKELHKIPKLSKFGDVFCKNLKKEVSVKLDKVKSKLLRIFTVIASMFLVIAPAFMSNNTDAIEAADVTSSLVDSITTNIGYAKPGQRVTFHLHFSGKTDYPVKAGDTIHVNFPQASSTGAGIQGISYKQPLIYHNPDNPNDPDNGVDMGTVNVTETGVTITFNQKAAGLKTIEGGDFSFTGVVTKQQGTNPTQVNPWPDGGDLPTPQIGVGQNIPSAPATSGIGTGTPNIVMPTGQIKKSGNIGNDGNVQWQIHGVIGNPGTTTITDQAQDGQTIVPGTFKITFFGQLADLEWMSMNEQYGDNGKLPAVSEIGSLNESSNGFTLDINDASVISSLQDVAQLGGVSSDLTNSNFETIAYTITYETKLASNETHTQWTNTAVQKNPDGSSTNTANGVVANTWSNDIWGTQPNDGVIFDKQTTDGEGLQGATFQLTGNGQNQTAVSNGAGVVKFTGLTNGDTYTVKEIKAPAGYKLNNETITVKIVNDKPQIIINGKQTNQNVIVDKSTQSSSSSMSSKKSSSSSKKSSTKSSSKKASSKKSSMIKSSSKKASSKKASSKESSKKSSMIKSSSKKASSKKASSKKSSSIKSSVKSSSKKSSMIKSSSKKASSKKASSKESSSIKSSAKSATSKKHRGGIAKSSLVKSSSKTSSKKSSVVASSKKASSKSVAKNTTKSSSVASSMSSEKNNTTVASSSSVESLSSSNTENTESSSTMNTASESTSKPGKNTETSVKVPSKASTISYVHKSTEKSVPVTVSSTKNTMVESSISSEVRNGSGSASTAYKPTLVSSSMNVPATSWSNEIVNGSSATTVGTTVITYSQSEIPNKAKTNNTTTNANKPVNNVTNNNITNNNHNVNKGGVTVVGNNNNNGNGNGNNNVQGGQTNQGGQGAQGNKSGKGNGNGHGEGLPQTGEAAASAIVGLGIALIAISGVVVLEKKKN